MTAEAPTIELRRDLATNDARCEACGETVWLEADSGSPTQAMFDHVRASHIAEGVIVSRFAEPTGRGDHAVMQFRRETELELQSRVDAWIRQFPTNAHSRVCEMTVACVQAGDDERAAVFASIRRELTRRQWHDSETPDHRYCESPWADVSRVVSGN
jgi:hypothetical protein